MIERSVPGYQQLLATLPMLSKRFSQANSHCYDLGCSLASVALQISQGVATNCSIVAVDQSAAMLAKAQSIIDMAKPKVSIQLVQADILQLKLQPASMVVLNYTLQFVKVSKRQQLLSKIYQALLPGGVLLLSEKVNYDNDFIQQQMQQLYDDFKMANGYSKMEISRKRAALEQVLICENEAQHLQRLQQLGFTATVWQRQLQFISFLAWK